MPAGPDHAIAREIRAARAYARMSREGLGKELGVSDATIGDWERGDFTREPPLAMLAAIADATGLPRQFDRVVSTTKPTVTRRAAEAADRLDDTPEASPGSDAAPGAEGASR